MKHAETQKRFFEQLDGFEQMARLFEFLPGVSFFVKDRRGRFIALNRRGCEYCGVSSEEQAIGRTDHDFFPHQRAEEYRADDEAVMRSGEPLVNRIESAPESAGSPRLVMTSKIPLRNRRGAVVGIAGFSRQIEQLREQSADADAFSLVVDHLHRYYADALTTTQLAKMAGLSSSQFERRFRHAFGSSPRQYLLRVRIENSSRLLIETEQTISQIALACGFFDHAHFSRSFRRIMSTSPSEYRRRHRGS
ncbi:AraC family transcriptional regulator [Aporhodopirellula aestuarii]|uniref:Helix-turn-helix domain-containing protein n=1 Tax=Aporhodopirellula aestuarii TaxID=2950107 RepID=A0ABT0U101_9BACT|nr:helix-turn-helix domain-containing protein [Aporhodopirellula aestuarii]MCM2370527.1 helix-turn-helix domain-containing protein [Aporhodopirellula aestuarii]